MDGKSATIGRADLSLIGVPLPEGAREVTLRFRSEPYETGRTVTLMALVLGLAAAAVGVVMEARRRV